MIFVRVLIIFPLYFSSPHCLAQSDNVLQPLSRFPGNYINEIAARISRVDKKLSRQTLKALQQFERLEAGAIKKIETKDSLTASLLNSKDKLEHLKREFADSAHQVLTRFAGEYNAYLDTLHSTLKFLEQRSALPGNSSQLERIKQVSDKLTVLEGKLIKAEEIKKYLRERKDFLSNQLQGYGINRKLRQLEKTGYYYAAYINEYKDILKDRKKLEKKAMSLLYALPAFKKFISENSLLAGLFKLPPAGNTQLPALPGVQTRAVVMQAMQDRINAGGSNAARAVQQQVQAAQAELKQLKDKISLYGSADAEIPGFRPNDQKTKTFLHRLDFGMNVQFGSSNNLLPATSDIAFTLGYKLNSSGTIGLGASYKIGLGKGWDKIKLSNEGIGLRSYLDWKLYGKFFISGGFEQNYNSGFSNIQQLKYYSMWQSSGLLGISKKMQIRGRKNVKLQVMYDFFCYRHVPISQPFVFRTGFSIK